MASGPKSHSKVQLNTSLILQNPKGNHSTITSEIQLSFGIQINGLKKEKRKRKKGPTSLDKDRPAKMYTHKHDLLLLRYEAFN